MKRLLITTLLTLFAIGSVSANYATDMQHSLLYKDWRADQSEDLSKLPPTAAGRMDQERQDEQRVKEDSWLRYDDRGGMQDPPSNRPSGL